MRTRIKARPLMVATSKTNISKVRVLDKTRK